MSEFDDEVAEALEETIDAAGGDAFTIGNQSYQGDLSELGQNSYAIVEGGKETIITATLIALRGQFGGTIPETGKRLKCGGRTWKIASFSSDPVSFTMLLANPDAH